MSRYPGEDAEDRTAPRLVASSEVVSEPDGALFYLARIPDGPIVVLDGVGELIWNDLPGRTRDELTDRIASHFDVEPGSIAADVESFVSSLISLGFILEAGRGGAPDAVN